MSDDLPLYRYVDGELVPIPGNKRDPNRRYRAVVAADKSYRVEFTDEEERQRDEEEARWKAKQPQREAEQRKKEEEFANFKASLQYGHRVGAFLDVMGWEQAINQSVENIKLTRDLGVAINSVQHHAGLIDWMMQNSADGKWPGDPQITHFSDCVLISVAADCYAQDTLLFHMRSLVSHMLNLGFVIRGGITIGALTHRGNMAYGPALIKAYKMERDIAKTPRIVLDPLLAEIWREGPRYQNKDGSLYRLRKKMETG